MYKRHVTKIVGQADKFIASTLSYKIEYSKKGSINKHAGFKRQVVQTIEITYHTILAWNYIIQTRKIGRGG
jgi:hypothetical protein